MRKSGISGLVVLAMAVALGPAPGHAQNIIDLLIEGIAKEAARGAQGTRRTINLPREYNNKTYMKRVQQALLAIGIDAGEPDGVFGNRTLRAIRTFQARYGFPDNGVLNTSQLNRLYALAAARQQNNIVVPGKTIVYRITADSFGGSGRRTISIQCQTGSTYVLYQMDKRRWRADTGAPDRDFHETALTICNS